MEKQKQELSMDELLEQALVPEVEQPYKVPGNWVWTNLGSLADFIGGGTPSKSVPNYWNGSIPWASVKDVKGKFLVSTVDSITENGVKNSATNLCEIGDLILVTRIEPGKTIISKLITAINQDLKIVKSGLPTQLLYYFFLNFGNELKKRASGSTVLGITIQNIASVAFPLSPLAEQQRIVDRIESLFAKLDQAKELVHNALDSFANRKAAILHQAFSGELTANWRKEHGIGIDSWKMKKLCETDIKIIDGDRGSNYPKKENFSDLGYCLFLNTKNVTKHGFVFNELQFISKEKDEQLRKGKLVRGDIVLTTRGTIGNIAYFDESVPYNNMRINSGMVIYRGGKHFYKPYLIWLYKSNYMLNQIETVKTGSAQPQLPIKVMNNLLLHIPSTTEQFEIVRILDDMFVKERQAHESIKVVLKQIDLIKKSILAKAFRGELGTNDPSEKNARALLKKVLQEKM